MEKDKINFCQFAGETSIVMTMNYLLGVDEDCFADMASKHNTAFKKLKQNKNARVLRNLCRIRNAIVINWETVTEEMTTARKSIYSVSVMPRDAFDQLSRDGVAAAKGSHTKPEYTLSDINGNISNRLGLCRSFFPAEIDWELIRSVFTMPGGLSHNGAYHAAEAFRRQGRHPLGVYANIKTGAGKRVFEDDLAFLAFIYGVEEKDFATQEGTMDAKRSLESFLSASRRTIIMVDCENADPIRLCAAINMLSAPAKAKITKVLLIDDEHTSPAWRIFSRFTTIQVQREVVSRIVADKSLVDIKLATTASMEHYKNNVDSFVLASSDSDYWGMITTMKTAKFLLLLQEKKCSPHMQEAAEQAGVPISWVDGVMDRSATMLRDAIIKQTVAEKLEELKVDVGGAIQQALKDTLLSLSEDDRAAAISDSMRNLTFCASENNAWFTIKRNGGE